jgi:D-glycero-D-manno-heptose 1,7-bisphosphate phosphatase
MNKAVFLDRDGVINRKAPGNGYITRWEDVEFLPGVARAIGLLNRAGFRVIVVSNQRCVAKGLVTLPELDEIHRRMREVLASQQAVVDAVYYCPHELEPPCPCRKPRPGLLLNAAREHAIVLAESWMIGDSEGDVEAGRNAGCRTARLLTNSETRNGNADLTGLSLIEVVHQVLQRVEGRSDRKSPEKNHSELRTLDLPRAIKVARKRRKDAQ